MPLVVSGNGVAEISAKIILSNIRIQVRTIRRSGNITVILEYRYVGQVLQSEQENWEIEDNMKAIIKCI